MVSAPTKPPEESNGGGIRTRHQKYAEIDTHARRWQLDWLLPRFVLQAYIILMVGDLRQRGAKLDMRGARTMYFGRCGFGVGSIFGDGGGFGDKSLFIANF
jgi:hypothetical protein